MKRLLSLFSLLIVFAFTCLADTWTVAGSPATLFNGQSWAPAATVNDMTLENGLYKWSRSAVALEAGKIEFKVVKNHAWTEAYPSSNYLQAVSETASYDVVITFNESTKAVTCTLTKVGSAEAQEHTYTVAGTPASLFGTEWAPGNTDNDMTLENGVYTWSKSDVTLSSGTKIEFKCTQDHAWDVAYPGSNYTKQVTEDGVYDVVITMNASSKAVNCELTKKGSAVVTHTYTVAGTPTSIFGTEWDNNNSANNMTEADGLYTYSKENIELAAGTTVAFKVVVDNNWDVAYPADNYELTAAAAGTYNLTITFNASTNEVKGNLVLVKEAEVEPYATVYIDKESVEGNIYAYDMVSEEASEYAAWTGTSIQGLTTGEKDGVEYYVFKFTHENASAPVVIFNDSEGQTANISVADGDVLKYLGNNAYILNGVQYPEKDKLYLMGLGDWTNGEEMTLGDDGKYTITKAMDANGEFKFRAGGTWYGPVSSGNFLVTQEYVENKTALSLTDDSGENNFTIPVAGEWTLTVDLEAKTLVITGEWKEAAHTYTVAGTPASVFGTEWDNNNSDNNMTEADGLYTYSKENIELAAGTTVAFKVVVDNNWDVAYPADNYELTATAAGTYNLTITFNASTNEVKGNLVLVKEAEVEPYATVYIDKESVEGNIYAYDMVSEEASEYAAWTGTSIQGLTTGEKDGVEYYVFKFTHENASAPVVIFNDSEGQTANISVADGDVLKYLGNNAYILNGVQYPEKDKLYLMGLGDWTNGEEMTLGDDGKYTITKAMDANGEFKFRAGGTWYGPVSSGNFLVTQEYVENKTALSLTDDSGENNFTIPVAGEWTLTVDLEAKTLVIEGEWKEAAKTVTYRIQGGVGENWENQFSIALTEKDGAFVAENQTIEALTEFKLVKNTAIEGVEETTDVWYGAESNGKFLVNEDMLGNDITMLAGAGENLYFEKAGVFSFSFDAEKALLTVTGEFEVEGVSLEEALEGEEGEVTIISDMAVVTAISDYAIVSDGEGNWLKVTGLELTEGDVIKNLKGEITLGTNPVMAATESKASDAELTVEPTKVDIAKESDGTAANALKGLKANEVITVKGYYSASDSKLKAFSGGHGLNIDVTTNHIGTLTEGKHIEVTGTVVLKEAAAGAPARVARAAADGSDITLDITKGGLPTGVATIKAIDGKEIQGIYNLNGQKVTRTDNGVYVIRYTDGTAAKVRF